MTQDPTLSNVAGDYAQVGVQASVVHGDVNYMISPDPSPMEKFEAGVRYLDGGMARRAWQLINEAVVDHHRTAKVCFYWPLALLSGRTRRELSNDELILLRNRDRLLPITGEGPWADGARMIRRLLDAAEQPGADIRLLLKEFDALPNLQRSTILRHLELFLEGQLNDELWHRRLQRAVDEQTGNDRQDRVWKFFQPTPAGPQVREPGPLTIPISAWLQAVAGAIVLVAGAVPIGYLLTRSGRIPELLAYLMSIVGGYFACRDGAEWHFRYRRRRAKDDVYGMPPLRTNTPPAEGFARRVDQRLEYYFAKRVPRGFDSASWLRWTVGIRKSLRDEIVGAYGETWRGVDKINWLIRHRAEDVKTRWENGTLWNYRHELATPPLVQAATVLGAMAFGLGAYWAARGALAADPLYAVSSLVLVTMGAWLAGRAFLRITLRRRWHDADKSEARQLADETAMAFDRWQRRLSDRPADREMATWLDHDRNVLLSEALQHYRLTMSDVIAHAAIEAPASTTRARVQGGLWRYRKYRILLFLLTADGVRQYSATLNFDDGTFHDRDRMSYRFESVAAVRVSQADNNARTFDLTLVDGQKISVQIEPRVEELPQGEDSESEPEETLDAAGVSHTLHVLEGIAAEGKAWMEHERRRADHRYKRPKPPSSGEDDER